MKSTRTFGPALAGVLVASCATVLPTGSAAALPAPSPAQGVTWSAGTVTSDAYVGASVADIRARVAKAQRIKGSSTDRACRSFITSKLPSWWGPSGHAVVCRPGKLQKKYDFTFDGVVLTVNTRVGKAGWAEAATWAPRHVAAPERKPLSSAPSLCRAAIKKYVGLAKKVGGYRVRCVPRITWKGPDASAKDLSVMGFIHYAKKDIAILETRDVAQMGYITAHEVGHAVAFMPKAKGLRLTMTRYAKRNNYESGPYIGMPAEIWAESFARYWSGYNMPTVQKKRLSPTNTAALLKKYGLPRR